MRAKPGSWRTLSLDRLRERGYLSLAKQGVELRAVTAFVDWKTRMLHSGVLSDSDAMAGANRTLERTARLIENVLQEEQPGEHFRVKLRLYHGWHKGFEPTENRKAIISIVASTDFSVLSRSPLIVFSPEVEYGDLLLTALKTRRLTRPVIHLPNTLRRQDKGKMPREKMVDTALAADLLAWAHDQPSEWALVVADDDDFVPPVYVAEAWMSLYGGRVRLVRYRSSKKFLRLDGLVVEHRA